MLEKFVRPFIALAGMLALGNAFAASLCETGHRQSPIDIRATQRQVLPVLNFSYPSVPMKIANDGSTVRVRFSKSGKLQIGQTVYTLEQFHFHTPGGERIGGEAFPMVAHILHKSAKGQLLAVAVPFRLGANNALLDKLLPLIPAKADGTHSIADQSVSAAELLPLERAYFRYSGSLTSAPCTEGVDWVVLKKPVELSEAQLQLYKKHFADNMRAPQPLYQRTVLESQ